MGFRGEVLDPINRQGLGGGFEAQNPEPKTTFPHSQALRALAAAICKAIGPLSLSAVPVAGYIPLGIYFHFFLTFLFV